MLLAAKCHISKLQEKKELTGILRGGDRLSDNCQSAAQPQLHVQRNRAAVKLNSEVEGWWVKRWMDVG